MNLEWNKEIRLGSVFLLGTTPFQAVSDGELLPCDVCETCDLYFLFTPFCERCGKEGGYHFKKLPLEGQDTWRLIKPVREELIEKGKLIPKQWDKDGNVTRVRKKGEAGER